MIQEKQIDERRKCVILENQSEAIDFAVKHFITTANHAINDHGYFTVALSGGSTPKAIFNKLSSEPYKNLVDYSKVYLFWSDERAVPLDDKESNYRMAMESGFQKLNLKKTHIFPMVDTLDLEKDAKNYQTLIEKVVPDGQFDLMMLGMGDDGHTASLFPFTTGLSEKKRWVIVNHIKEKQCDRLTLTYPIINRAKEIVIYVLGPSKAKMLKDIFFSEKNINKFPIQEIGTESQKALFILDKDSAEHINL